MDHLVFAEKAIKHNVFIYVFDNEDEVFNVKLQKKYWDVREQQ